MPSKGSKSVDMDDEQAWEIANLYVNCTGYNANEAWRRWHDMHGKEYKPKSVNNASRFFRTHPQIMKYVEELKAENRARYPEMRDINVNRLNEIANNGKASDRIAAIKELNSMFGYNQQNINMDATQTINVSLVD